MCIACPNIALSRSPGRSATSPPKLSTPCHPDPLPSRPGFIGNDVSLHTFHTVYYSRYISFYRYSLVVSGTRSRKPIEEHR